MERYFFYLIIGRFVLPALFIGLLGAQLAAQEGIHNSSSDRKSNTLQIAWGVQYNRAQDLVFSPMIYESNAAWTLGLNYKKQKARGWYQLGFAYDDAKLSPETLITSPVFGTRARSESKQFALHFAYAGLMNDHQKFNIHLGVQLDVRFHQIDYAFGLGIEESYFFANSVSPLLNFAWRLGEKNRLETGFSLPLLSFIARPEYAIVDNRNIQGEEGIAYLYKKGKFVSLAEYRSYHFFVGFTRVFSNSLDGFVRFQSQYHRVEMPQTLSILKNNFDLGLSLKF